MLIKIDNKLNSNNNRQTLKVFLQINKIFNRMTRIKFSNKKKVQSNNKQ